MRKSLAQIHEKSVQPLGTSQSNCFILFQALIWEKSVAVIQDNYQAFFLSGKSQTKHHRFDSLKINHNLLSIYLSIGWLCSKFWIFPRPHLHSKWTGKIRHLLHFDISNSLLDNSFSIPPNFLSVDLCSNLAVILEHQMHLHFWTIIKVIGAIMGRDQWNIGLEQKKIYIYVTILDISRIQFIFLTLFSGPMC